MPHTNPYVCWTGAEWRMFALALMRTAPELRLPRNHALDGLSVAMMHRAVQLMPQGRIRKFYSTSQVRSHLQEIYAKAVADKDPMFLGDTEPAASTAPAAEVPPAVPVVPAPTAAPAAAVVETPPPPTPPMRHASRQFSQPPVRWSDAEWCQVAAQIQRDNPGKHFLDAKVLEALRISDVKKAQHVLPLNRQRHGLDGVVLARLHPSLRQAFQSLLLKSESSQLPGAAPAIEQEPAVATTPTATEPTAAPGATAEPPAPAGAATAVEAMPAQAPLHAPTATATPAPTVNPWEAAFKPLLSPFLNLLTHEVMAQVEQRLFGAAIQQALAPLVQSAVAQMVPTIAGSVQQVMAQQLAAWEPTIPAAPAPTLTLVASNPEPQADGAVIEDKTAAAPAPAAQVVAMPPKAKPAAPVKRFKIGVIGNRNAYADELEREFKMFDFICIDNQHQMDRIRGCDRIYLLTRFSDHASQHRAKALGLDFSYVNGGLSTLKRLLRGLQHDLAQKK